MGMKNEKKGVRGKGEKVSTMTRIQTEDLSTGGRRKFHNKNKIP